MTRAHGTRRDRETPTRVDFVDTAPTQDRKGRGQVVSSVVNTLLLVMAAFLVGAQALMRAPWLWVLLVVFAVALGMLTFRGPRRHLSGLVVPAVTILGFVAWGLFASAVQAAMISVVIIVAVGYGAVVWLGARTLCDRGWLIVPAVLAPASPAGPMGIGAASLPGAGAAFVALVLLAVLFGSDHWTPDRPGMRKSHRQRPGRRAAP